MKSLVSLSVLIGTVLIFVGCSQQNIKPQTPPVSGLQSIYFDFDRSNIRSDAVSVIEGNGSYLKQNNDAITIEGNCDNRGTNEYNIALGQRRADSAKNYLINLGINSTRMKTVTYGEERPSCQESTESCWQKNRRDDFQKN